MRTNFFRSFRVSCYTSILFRLPDDMFSVRLPSRLRFPVNARTGMGERLCNNSELMPRTTRGLPGPPPPPADPELRRGRRIDDTRPLVSVLIVMSIGGLPLVISPPDPMVYWCRFLVLRSSVRRWASLDVTIGQLLFCWTVVVTAAAKELGRNRSSITFRF